MRSFPGNPYDGHTLAPTLEQVEILTDQRPDLAVVDHGYRGHGALKTRVLISGTRRGLTPKLIPALRRRNAIEAEIDHIKTDGHPSRSRQKRHKRRPPLRYTLRLRSQHRKDPGIPQGFFSPHDRPDPAGTSRNNTRATTCQDGLIMLFNLN